MSEQGTFKVSQGLEVLAPRSAQAYPIPCEEWANLKTKVSKLSSEPWFFHTAGSTSLGAAATTFISILVGTFSSPAQQTALVIAWAVVATTLTSGALCLLLAHKQRGVQRERAKDVIAQMELIEMRYDRAGDDSAQPPGYRILDREAIMEAIQLGKEKQKEPMLEIIKAEYGTARARVDVTQELRNMIVHNRLQTIASNAIKGDPDYGAEKQLSITYKFKGITETRKFNEGDMVVIPSRTRSSEEWVEWRK